MATIRGVLTAWDGANYLADVRLDGSSLAVVEDVRTSRGIDSAEMVTTRKVVIDTGDSRQDWVVVAVYVP